MPYMGSREYGALATAGGSPRAAAATTVPWPAPGSAPAPGPSSVVRCVAAPVGGPRAPW